jgi:hypothetical protein
MKEDKSKQSGSIFKSIFSKLAGGGTGQQDTGEAVVGTASPTDNLKIIEEYEAIRQQPDELTGWDFDRAFVFLESHPNSSLSDKLKEEMYSTSSTTLKGLSYESAVKVLERMPDHPGADSILKGFNKLEKDYIKELKSDVIAYILTRIPDHALQSELTTALAVKNLTNAYDFVENNPEHPCTPLVIQAMFDRDANIATLLLHERMDHPRVDAIFKGIYSISKEAVSRLMPDAILFIMDVAVDHPYAEEMIQRLIEVNYIKAFDLVQSNPAHAHAGRIKELIGAEHPELVALLG